MVHKNINVLNAKDVADGQEGSRHWPSQQSDIVQGRRLPTTVLGVVTSVLFDSMSEAVETHAWQVQEGGLKFNH